MRMYRLIFDNNSLELNALNPTALRIEFNIASYDGSARTAPSLIKVYNMDKVFNEVDKFKDKMITLYAGLIEDPTMKFQGIEGFQTNLLQGKILGSATTWQGKETILNLAVGLIASPNGIKQVGQINVSDPVAQQVVDIIKANFGEQYKFKITPEANEVRGNTRTTIPIRPRIESANFLIFFDRFLNQFGLKMTYDGSVQEFTIKKAGELNNKLHFINPVNLISQPEYVNVGQIMVTTQLNGQYRIGDSILLPTELPLVGSFSTFSDIMPLSANDAMKISAKGLYEIVSINHIGDSRGASGMNWASQLLCQAQNVYKGFEAQINEYTSKYLGTFNKYINLFKQK